MAVTKKAKVIIKEIVDSFETDGASDYSRMDAEVYKATGLKLDNKSLWSLINRAQTTTERISFSLDD